MNTGEHPQGHVLQAYHDGELSPAETTEVGSHCEQCADCRAELDELESVIRMLGGAPEPELPRSVWHRVRPSRPRESRLKPVFAYGACAAGIVLGVMLGPIGAEIEESVSDQTWSETVTVWSGDSTSPLLSVYQTGQE